MLHFKHEAVVYLWVEAGSGCYARFVVAKSFSYARPQHPSFGATGCTSGI